jgi:uncharacterized protein YndB with AHSA1/START domain
MSTEIKEAVTIHAPAGRVWDVLLDTASWWPEMKLDPSSGGVFEETWFEGSVQKKMRGMIVGFIPGERVRLSWKEDAWPGRTEVVLDIVPQGEHETKAEIRHSGWEVFPEADRQQVIDAHAEGWRYHLGQLKAAVEG